MDVHCCSHDPTLKLCQSQFTVSKLPELLSVTVLQRYVKIIFLQKNIVVKSLAAEFLCNEIPSALVSEQLVKHVTWHLFESLWVEQLLLEVFISLDRFQLLLSERDSLGLGSVIVIFRLLYQFEIEKIVLFF